MSQKRTMPKLDVKKPKIKPISGASEDLNRLDLILIICIVLGALAILWRVTKNGFTDWDDDLYVVQNILIQKFDWPTLKLSFTTLTANLYTPLVTISYALDFRLYGLHAAGFHSTNLIIHCVNIVLVYALTFKLFRKTFLAAAATFIFSIHPLNIEAIAWISSRKDLLFSMFYLAGLIVYLIYLERKQKPLLILVFVLFIFSIFSKPIALTFPFVLLAFNYFKNKTITKNELLEKIPFMVVSIAFAVMGLYLVKEYDVFATAPIGYNFFDKVCMAAYSLAFYLYNLFIPAGISNYHAYPFKDGAFLTTQYVLAPLVVLFVLFILYKYIRKNFDLVFGLIVFLFIIGPTLRLVPTGYPVAADRYFYLASVGLIWTVILMLQKISSKSFPIHFTVLAGSLIFVLACSIISFRRVGDWKDSYSLWNSTLKNNPHHEIANEHLGKLYNNAGDKDSALVYFQQIINRNKTNYDILNSAGNILVDKNQPDLAINYFDMAIATGKANHLPYYNRGMVYSTKNKFKQAISDFNEALKLKPDFAEAYNNRGIAKVKSGDTLGAYADFANAVKFKPSDKMMEDNLVRIKSYVTIPH